MQSFRFRSRAAALGLLCAAGAVMAQPAAGPVDASALAAGAAKLGFVADLLSKPTMVGYMNGLALTILVGQIRKLCGFTVEADGPLALFRTRTLRIEPRPEGSRLRLLATLRDPVPPRGLPEGTRRRLVFELGSELLALDRHSTEE